MRERKSPPLPRLPPILADEVSDALSRAREVMTPDEMLAELAKYRRNITLIAARYGVTGRASGPRPRLSIIRHHAIVTDLATAFRKLHRYRGGGAAEYLAVAVLGVEISWRTSGKPRMRGGDGFRNKAAPLSDIVAFLDKRDYPGASHGEKGAIVDAAGAHFGVSERQVRRAIKSLKGSKMP